MSPPTQHHSFFRNYPFIKKKLPSPPLCFGQTTANHHPTPHCGFTLIGNQKKTIIQAYTRPGKNAKASYSVKSHLRPQTLTAVKVSKQQPPPPPSPQPCAFDTQLRVRTVPGLFVSLHSAVNGITTRYCLTFEHVYWGYI